MAPTTSKRSQKAAKARKEATKEDESTTDESVVEETKQAKSTTKTNDNKSNSHKTNDDNNSDNNSNSDKKPAAKPTPTKSPILKLSSFSDSESESESASVSPPKITSKSPKSASKSPKSPTKSPKSKASLNPVVDPNAPHTLVAPRAVLTHNSKRARTTTERLLLVQIDSALDLEGVTGAIGRLEANQEGVTLDLKGQLYKGRIYPGPTAMVWINQDYERTYAKQQPRARRVLRLEGMTDEFCRMKAVSTATTTMQGALAGRAGNQEGRFHNEDESSLEDGDYGDFYYDSFQRAESNKKKTPANKKGDDNDDDDNEKKATKRSSKPKTKTSRAVTRKPPPAAAAKSPTRKRRKIVADISSVESEDKEDTETKRKRTYDTDDSDDEDYHEKTAAKAKSKAATGGRLHRGKPQQAPKRANPPLGPRRRRPPPRGNGRPDGSR